MVHDLDQRVRLAAFAFLDALQRSAASDVISRDRLIEGFLFEGQRVPLVSPQQGIFKPRLLPAT
jgi:putative restriction endonuclease